MALLLRELEELQVEAQMLEVKLEKEVKKLEVELLMLLARLEVKLPL